MAKKRKLDQKWKKLSHYSEVTQYLRGLKQAKELIQGASAKKRRELLNVNRDQLRWAVGMLTGHCHLKGHLFKVALVNSLGT
jgi:hypothetical protein